MELQADLDKALVAHLEAEAVIDRDKIANLEFALATARQIGTAIGVLMMRHKVTADRAFELLRRVSQDSHRKLRDIALEVMETGDL